MLAMMPVAAAEGETPDKWGTLDWNYDESSKTLTISGEGEMPDTVSDTERPYDRYKSDITEVVIREGVTSIGQGLSLIAAT